MGVKGEYGKWGCDDYWLTTLAINIHSDGLVSPMEYREGWLPSVLLRCVPAVQNVLVSGANIRPQNILWAVLGCVHSLDVIQWPWRYGECDVPSESYRHIDSTVVVMLRLNELA